MKAKKRRVFGNVPGWMVALVAVVSVSAQDLQEDSPFLPADYQKAPDAAPEPAKASPLDKLELRSISFMGGTHHFSLFDTTVSKGFWIKLDETIKGITVSDFDKVDGSVLVRSGGFTRRLKLKEAKIIALTVPVPSAQPASAPAATAAAGSANMTVGTTGQPAANAPAINNLSDDEVRARMQRVAEEIRRRRAMRREMAEQATQSQQ